ncbi:helix-turn-helix transcriptional regulator [Mycoplasmatota bacterium zrk1]
MNFGINLKRIRTAKGYTQSSLAKVLNISQNTLSQYESSKRQPDLHTFTNICDVLEVEADYFFKENIEYAEDVELYELMRKMRKFEGYIIELSFLLNVFGDNHNLISSQLDELEKLYDKIKFYREIEIKEEIDFIINKAEQILNVDRK